MKTPILGGSYIARSVNAADNRMVNLFPEAIPEGGKEPAFLQRTPGLALWSYAGSLTGVPSSYPVRGMILTYDISASGSPAVIYVVCGDSGAATVYSFRSDTYAWVTVGTVDGTDSVSMASSGTEVFIATNAGSGYIVTIATDTIAQIVDADFPGARQVTYLNGRFVFCTCRDQKVWCTDLLAGGSIDPLNFASAEKSPDPVIGVAASNGELWVFGTQTTEVWRDTGGAGFPYEPIQGVNINTGCVSGFTVVKVDESLFWLGQDINGRCVVYRSNGYSAQRVSNHSIEWQIQDYTLSGPPWVQTNEEPWALSYQQQGHLFYILTFPNQGTWVYDVVTQEWHERTASVSLGGPYRARGVAVFPTPSGVLTLVGDSRRDVIYSLDLDVYNDFYSSDGVTVTYDDVEWIRTWRALAPGMNNLKRTAHHSLQVDCETGVGDGSVTNPTMTLKWSDDGGHSFTTGVSKNMGINGDYSVRVIWRRLGMTRKLRDRVYHLSGTDAAKVFINGAELIMSPTDA